MGGGEDAIASEVVGKHGIVLMRKSTTEQAIYILNCANKIRFGYNFINSHYSQNYVFIATKYDQCDEIYMSSTFTFYHSFGKDLISEIERSWHG